MSRKPEDAVEVEAPAVTEEPAQAAPDDSEEPLGVKCSQLDHWRKRFAWALDRRYTTAQAMEHLEQLHKALGDTLPILKELAAVEGFVPNPGETGASEKASGASYINDIGEHLLGIALAMMIREDFFPTDGIPDGPPAEVPTSSAASPLNLLMAGKDNGMIQ